MQYAGFTVARILKSEIIQKCRTVSHVMFTKHLFLTNVGISLSLSGVGDIIQQHYELLNGDHEKWNRTRTLHMSLTGMTIGVFCHHSYKWLDSLFPGRTLRTVIKKVLVDQLINSPICITIFFATLSCLERSSFETFVKELKQKGWRLYVADWVVWPPAQLINFYILPTRFRVLYDNTISLGYDVYTSYVAHEIPLEDEKEDGNDKRGMPVIS
ncbi:mpv17-like protein 2 [Periplaneta americana]|uniref:mpv17-like protein 2 n=1 Tax=Periplaneta americana TaxID=6978 RepID=UPI0037E8E4A8